MKLEIYEYGYVITRETGTVQFGLIRGEPIGIYEGSEAIEQFWLMEFNKLNENNRAFIVAVFPDVFDKLKELAAEMKEMKHPNRFYKMAENKVLKTELASVCSRCGGTGRYSYNYVDGSMCYGCRGQKIALPKITKKFIKSVTEYFANNRS